MSLGAAGCHEGSDTMIGRRPGPGPTAVEKDAERTVIPVVGHLALVRTSWERRSR
jgi:hypothetical protein